MGDERTCDFERLLRQYKLTSLESGLKSESSGTKIPKDQEVDYGEPNERGESHYEEQLGSERVRGIDVREDMLFVAHDR